MKLGDFFVEIGVKSDSKSIKAVEEHINSLKKLQKEVAKEIQMEKELAEAQTEEQKARIKKKFALEKEIDVQEANLKQQKAQIANFKGMIKGALGVASAISVAVGVIDRMATALARSNQRLMNFQHQTGINISTLNKYANANVAVNPLASIEGTAGSLQNVASNLWDIQMGRGDVSAYQELSYFSGQQVEPYGKSIEQVIESVRSALTKIPNDVQATNLIQRMGFSPDDLQILRMTRAEFEKTQDVFLSATQREELENLSKELNLIHLRGQKIYQEALIPITKFIIRLEEPLVRIGENIMNFYHYLEKMPRVLSIIKVALIGIITILNPTIGALSMLYLMIDDIIGYFQGKESALGYLLYYMDELGNSLKKSFDASPLIKSIKEIGNAINTNFIGAGFNSLDRILGLFSMLNPINFVSTGALALQKAGTNYNNNTTNNISLMTNNPAVADNTMKQVLQNNNAKAGM